MKSVIIPQNLCDTTASMKTALNSISLYKVCGNPFSTNKKGFMIMELLVALIVLSFIVRPVVVESENEWGDRTTSIEWELPMAKLLDHVADLQGLIDKSWAGIDKKFHYAHRNMGARAGELMAKSLKNGVVMMTAGFVDQQGRFTGDFDNNAARFESAAKGMTVAYYNAAQEGMHQ